MFQDLRDRMLVAGFEAEQFCAYRVLQRLCERHGVPGPTRMVIPRSGFPAPGGGEVERADWTITVMPLSRIPAIRLATRHALIADMQVIRAERWIASSHDPTGHNRFARTTDQRPEIGDPVDEHLLRQLESPDVMVSGSAYASLAHG